MDNLAHTLTGWALARAGLARRSGLATPVLMIAANIPDLDVIGLPFGHNLAWRRGWTHGPVGDLLLPPLLVLCAVAWDRRQARRGTRPADRAPVSPAWLLLCAWIGLASHLALDLANSYGIRLLMPVSDRWFYGDTLFIVDPWLWSALALGIWLSRRGGGTRPARAALAASVLYIAAMNAGSGYARRLAGGATLAAPVPVNPFRRDLVAVDGAAYRFGEADLLAGRATLGPPVPTNMAAVPAAPARRDARDFLYWSRLPFAARRGDAWVVGDARFGRTPDGRFSVTIPAR